jgi:Cu(I)/Ag(I) efflux system membrane fusion protein
MSSSSVFALLATWLVLSGCARGSGSPDAGPHEGHGAAVRAQPSATAEKPAPAEEKLAPAEDHAGHERHPPPAVSGYAPFTLDPARASAVGLQVAPVAARAFKRVVRTTGVVVLDETRTSHVHSKVRGWIERVNVDFVGKRVTAGTPLCAIYSQEVLAAQLEFLSVLDQTAAPSLPGVLGEAETQARARLLEAGRRRLALWDVPEREIARLESTRTPLRTFTLTAPRSGIVVARQAIPGTFIDPSVELYVVSDVGKLWLLADVYEVDAPWIRPGAMATVRFEGLTSEKRQARLSFVPPTVDEATRTLKVRFDLDNPAGTLRPGAFATVELDVDLGEALAIPEEAVIHTGPRAIAFRVSGERVEPRAIELGPLVDGYYRVEGGLNAGEHVAVGAQFLIDSESRLRATTGQGPSHAGH